MEKTFVNIAELTAQYEKWREGHQETETRYMDSIQIWQAKAQLAIAQQLSVISGTLKDLLELCQSQSTRPSSKTTRAKS